MKKINNTLLLGALLGFCACHFESFDERCAREAREYTEKQCPRRMDQYTLMDSLTYDDHSRTLNYYYTLEGVLDNDTVMNAQSCESLKEKCAFRHDLPRKIMTATIARTANL